MKKFLLAFALLLGFAAVPCFAQQPAFVQATGTFTGTTVPGAQGYMLQNSTVTQHTLTWTAASTVSSCTVVLQTSPDNVTWSTMAGTASQTCTSSGTYTASGTGAVYVRFNISAFSATGTVSFTYYGYTSSPTIQTTDNFVVNPCNGLASGNTTGTNGQTSIGASNYPVWQVSTSATGTNTHTYNCLLVIPARTTSGKGIVVSGATFYYGVQTAAPASQTLPTCGTVTMPVAGASETPSTVTPVAAGGTITATPAVASANLGTTTAGAFYSSAISFSTPVAATSSIQELVCTFPFVGSVTTAFTTNSPGITWSYSNTTP